jgi:hypothetical protein
VQPRFSQFRPAVRKRLRRLKVFLYTKDHMNEPKTDSEAVRLGRRGGKAGKGAAKARSREQAQAAAKARWDKQKEEQK